MIGGVAIVAVGARGVPIAIQDEAFGGVVGIRTRGEGVTNLCELGEYV